ncbi:MAG TPA: Gfo/Idh/MocA family oxidoreductase [Leeuwenhoekiella sp.]|nr:Gfo/Idh/MocA family oxidoreductase [Leeuwenhoekiella sp.]
MPHSSKLNIALIGLGAIAQKAYLPILAAHAQVEPILCTRDSKTLKQLSRQYRIEKCFSNLDDLMKTKPDAAMVHSATESHFSIVSQLLKARIPTFVDKPLAYSLKEVEELLELATQKQTLLYLGFNRRFAPLVKKLTAESNPVQILWQKNRINLPGDPRVFIFDDFIHVIDSLRFLGSGAVKNLQVFSKMNKGLLESIQVQWQQNDTLLNGLMNRVSGVTEERIEYFSKGNKWLLEGLDSGCYYHNGSKNLLGFDNWDSTLYKRGFTAMIADWLDVLENGKFDPNRIQDIWETHRLCEEILSKLQMQ